MRLRLTSIALGATASALLLLGNASAHARYKESIPAKGEVLAASPSQVSITFTQDVQKVTGTYGIQVRYAPTGRSGIVAEATSGPAVLDDADRTLMTVPLRTDLTLGRYEVHWKNVSDADGDPAEGAFSFYIGVEPTADDLAADQELALIGEEQQTPQPTEDGATPAPGDTPAATATPSAGSPDDDEGDNNALIIIGVIVVVGVVVGFLAARFITRRRT
jgi:methionine-rich copper-binding protein CopC